MKLYVYAIAKNEEKFAERWLESMKEADGVFVLDTGSTDRTVEILKAGGAEVCRKIITPWRFDTARNESLKLVPDDADLCVCTDLDEVFHPGWRQAMEQALTDNVTRLRYRYTWNFSSDGKENVVFFTDKAHRKQGYFWKNPVHEVLISTEPETIATASGVQLDHHADPLKDRSSYLPLLELSVKEDPDNDRNAHYLGREYYFHGLYQKAIKTLSRHLSLPSSVWADERCASERYLAKCFQEIGNFSEAYRHLLAAIREAPHLREPWLDAAIFEYKRENWLGCAYFIEYALLITERPTTYMTEAASWDATPYDLLSIAYYRMGLLDKAIENIRRAMRYSGEERLKKNLSIFENEEIGKRD